MWQQEEYISKKEGPLPLKHKSQTSCGTSKRMSPKTLGCNTDS